MTSRPTIVDVAVHAGVSKSLVSLVLRGSPNVSDDRRRRVEEAVQALGYRPNGVARSLVRQRSSLIGVMLSDLNNPFFAQLADRIETAAMEAEYRALFNSGGRDPERERVALDTLLQLRTDGVIVAGPAMDDTAFSRAAQETPLVLATRHSRSSLFDSVATDDRGGARLAVDHLADLGHTRIAHISGAMGAGADRRLDGYSSAMADRGLTPIVAEGSYTEDGGLKAVKKLFKHREPPTAIFACNDFAAVGIVQGLYELGLRVPDDVSVVGYDDTWMAALSTIGLTTVHQSLAEIGSVAVCLLLERLDQNRTKARHVVLNPSFTIRSTTAMAPTRGKKS